MDAKDKVLMMLSMTLVFVFAFWSGGQYERYKIQKTVTSMIDGFDALLDEADDILEDLEGDESSYNDTFSQY